jgi:hypothetical protein
VSTSGSRLLTALAAGVAVRLISARVLRVAVSLSFATLLGLVPAVYRRARLCREIRGLSASKRFATR